MLKILLFWALITWVNVKIILILYKKKKNVSRIVYRHAVLY